MDCPKCGSGDHHKAGFVGDAQRWRCRSCGCKFTRGTSWEKPMEMRRQALRLYLEGMGFRAIGRVLGVSNVTVLKWIRAFGEEAERERKPEEPPKIAMIDEVWHFTAAKKTNAGSGFRNVSSPAASAASISADEAPKTSKTF